MPPVLRGGGGWRGVGGAALIERRPILFFKFPVRAADSSATHLTHTQTHSNTTVCLSHSSHACIQHYTQAVSSSLARYLHLQAVLAFMLRYTKLLAFVSQPG